MGGMGDAALWHCGVRSCAGRHPAGNSQGRAAVRAQCWWHSRAVAQSWGCRTLQKAQSWQSSCESHQQEHPHTWQRAAPAAQPGGGHNLCAQHRHSPGGGQPAGARQLLVPPQKEAFCIQPRCFGGRVLDLGAKHSQALGKLHVKLQFSSSLGGRIYSTNPSQSSFAFRCLFCCFSTGNLMDFSAPPLPHNSTDQPFLPILFLNTGAPFCCQKEINSHPDNLSTATRVH